MADRPQRTRPGRLHQCLEGIPPLPGHLLQTPQLLLGLGSVEFPELGNILHLLVLFLVARTHQFLLTASGMAFLAAQERIHADDRQAAVVLPVLVIRRLVLDPVALLHRSTWGRR